MAVNETRSMNKDLREGITDGSVKKYSPNRGGQPHDDASVVNSYQYLSRDLYDPSIAYDAHDTAADRWTDLKS